MGDRSALDLEVEVEGDGGGMGQTLRYSITAIDLEIQTAFENYQILSGKEMKAEAASLKRLIDVCRFVYNEMKLLKKTNEELLPKIADADEKLIVSFQATASTQQTINRLKAALEEAWKEVDASRAREQDYQEEIIELQAKCKSEKKTDGEEEDASLGPLAKHKGALLRERDRLSGEVRELEKRLQIQRFYGETLEQLCQQIEDVNRGLRANVEDMEMTENRNERRIQMLMKTIDDLKDTNKMLLKKIDGYEKQIEEQSSVIRDRAKEIEKLRSSFDKLKSDYTQFKKKLVHLKKNYRFCVQDRKTLNLSLQEILRENKAKDNEIFMMTKNYKKVRGDFENLSLKVFKLQKNAATLNADMIKYKNQVNTRDKDIINHIRTIEELRRLKEIITHERDSLRSEIIKLNNSIAELRHLNIMRNITIDNLQLDIRKQQLKLEETKKVIARVERERDEQIQEVEMLNDKIDYLNEQVQLKADHVIELQRQLQDKHANLIKVQKLLETTNSERLLLQRSLQSCGEERTNLKNLQSVTAHQMAQLTEEISANQLKINNLHLQIDKLQKEKQELLTELLSTKKLLSNTRQELKDMKAINDKLQKTLMEDELRFMQLNNTLEETRKEKNLIGLQMVRRNDEISLLRERLDIVQTAVDRGGVQYNQRIEDIRLLKLEIKHLYRQRDVLKRGVSQNHKMKREIIRLQRSLDKEQIQCRALKEDLRLPVNIHRWRILRGTDPDRYSLVEKTRLLQKRLLMTYIEGCQREKSLQNCHKLYISLKTFVERLPSFKVKEDLVEAQRVLRNREKKLKSLAAELTATAGEVQSRDCTIAELTTNLITVKKELFIEKKVVSRLQARDPIPLPLGQTSNSA